jgi:riboflavin biosynthesis pyrimidine reductase
LGEDARAAIAGADALKLSDARRWKRVSVRELDADLWETYERA